MLAYGDRRTSSYDDLLETLTSHIKREPEALSVKTLNQNVVEAEYAVRGAIAIKSAAYQQQLKEGKGDDLPFDKKPITFFRQVLSLCEYRELLDNELAAQIYPPDAIERARQYLDGIPGGVGAYSESKGAVVLRKQVAQGIEARDGHPCDIDNLWLTDGASPAVHYCMKSLLRNEHDCILCPIPQYPLYSATIKLYGGTLLPYYLEESEGWQTTLDNLRVQVGTARRQGKQVRAMVVINPGNPTGQVLDRDNQELLVRFCKEEGLVLMADEVYQTNIYAEGKSFVSFKKVLMEMGDDCTTSVPLVSMNSISKGFFGECGRRGGYFECINFPKEVKDQLYKLSSISLCPNLSGQICMALTMNPPKPGEPSYELFAKERDDILSSLKRRAVLVKETFDSLEGVSCTTGESFVCLGQAGLVLSAAHTSHTLSLNSSPAPMLPAAVEGSMYAFPRLTIPPAAVKAAADQDKQPDFVYCMELLDKTGIVTVPGSGFGQEKGTFHVRTTILPPESDMQAVSDKFAEFHKGFMAKYKNQNGSK
ncbi:Alanine aminotransferase 2 [Chlorella vulgaris]